MSRTFRRSSVPLGALALAALALTPGLAAQEAPEAVLGEVVLVHPKPGQARAMEAGMTQYFQDMEAEGLSIGWSTWSIMTGENTGAYYVGTFGHTWADFDAMMAGGEPLRYSFIANIEPYVEDAEVMFVALRPDLSYGVDPAGEPPALEMMFWMKPTPAGAREWEGMVEEIVGAATEAAWAGNWVVYQLVNGGEMPLYVLGVGADSFAGFAEPSPGMDEMLAAQLGEDRAEEMMQRFPQLLEWEKSEMIAWRGDLAYTP